MSKVQIKYTVIYEKETIIELDNPNNKWKKNIHDYLQETMEIPLIIENIEKEEFKEVGIRIKATAHQAKFIRNHIENYKTIKKTSFGSTLYQFISKYTYLP